MESFHAARAVAPACEPRLWSLPLLEASRERVLAGDLKSPLKRLLGDADLWLARSRKSDQLFTVTTKPATPSVTYSCSPHCFYSLGTYWWPNNATPDGLPYVRDDGLVNPDDPLNREAAALLRSNKTQFQAAVKRTLQGYASPEGQTGFTKFL